MRDARAAKPLILQGPLHFEATFRKEELARKFNTWKFKRIGKTVEWDAKNMIQGFDRLNKLTFFPKRIYPIRRPLLHAMRTLYRIRNTWLSPGPNLEGAVPYGTRGQKSGTKIMITTSTTSVSGTPSLM